MDTLSNPMEISPKSDSASCEGLQLWSDQERFLDSPFRIGVFATGVVLVAQFAMMERGVSAAPEVLLLGEVLYLEEWSTEAVTAVQCCLRSLQFLALAAATVSLFGPRRMRAGLVASLLVAGTLLGLSSLGSALGGLRGLLRHYGGWADSVVLKDGRTIGLRRIWGPSSALLLATEEREKRPWIRRERILGWVSYYPSSPAGNPYILEIKDVSDEAARLGHLLPMICLPSGMVLADSGQIARDSFTSTWPTSHQCLLSVRGQAVTPGPSSLQEIKR